MPEVIYRIYLVLLAAGIICGFYRFKFLSGSSRYFLLLLVITMLFEILAKFLSNEKNGNYLSYHIFSPIEYSIIAFAYYLELRKKIIFISIFLMVALSVFLSLFVQDITHFNTYFLNTSLLIVIILCFIYLYNLLNQKVEFNFTQYPLFWISCGFLLFDVSNLLGFGAFNYLIKILRANPILFDVFTVIRITTNFILYVLFIIAFLSKQKTLNSSIVE